MIGSDFQDILLSEKNQGAKEYRAQYLMLNKGKQEFIPGGVYFCKKVKNKNQTTSMIYWLPTAGRNRMEGIRKESEYMSLYSFDFCTQLIFYIVRKKNFLKNKSTISSYEI